VNIVAKKKKDEDFSDDDSRDDAGRDDADEEPEADEGDQNFDSFLPPNFSEYMNKFMKDFLKNFNPQSFAKLSKEFEKQMREGGPIRPAVFGFNIGIGPDGKPTLQNFGNVKQRQGKPEVKEVRDPLVDIVEEGDEFIVVAEIPGVRKEDISLSATETTLSITARSADKERNYEKVVEISAKINPNVAKARYTNGILEVRLQKIGQKKQPGSSISIE